MAQPRVRRPFTLERLANFLLRTLATEFLLGMILNLYVPLPFPSPLDLVATLGIVVLIAHILVGLGALGLSLRMTVQAARAPGRSGLALSAVAAGSMVVSFLSGMSFAFRDPSTFSSLLMTVGFYVGMMAATLLVARPARPTEAPSAADGGVSAGAALSSQLGRPRHSTFRDHDDPGEK